MSKNKHRASREAAPNVPTTAQTDLPPPADHQEKTMEASQEKPPEAAAEVPPEVSRPTAKAMAAAEEQNQLRLRQLAEQADAPPPPEPTNIMDVAARGYDALHEAFAKHNAIQPKVYVPPPRTERQMTSLQEELAAGARAVARAEEQKAAAQPVISDLNKEGFTTPVYRPGDVVPDPTIPAKGGSVAGSRQFGADAP